MFKIGKSYTILLSYFDGQVYYILSSSVYFYSTELGLIDTVQDLSSKCTI